jgi:hypothetical protein
LKPSNPSIPTRQEVSSESSLVDDFDINMDQTTELKKTDGKPIFDVKEVYNEIEFLQRNTSNAKLKFKLDRHDDLSCFEGEGLYKGFGAYDSDDDSE